MVVFVTVKYKSICWFALWFCDWIAMDDVLLPSITRLVTVRCVAVPWLSLCASHIIRPFKVLPCPSIVKLEPSGIVISSVTADNNWIVLWSVFASFTAAWTEVYSLPSIEATLFSAANTDIGIKPNTITVATNNDSNLYFFVLCFKTKPSSFIWQMYFFMFCLLYSCLLSYAM